MQSLFSVDLSALTSLLQLDHQGVQLVLLFLCLLQQSLLPLFLHGRLLLVLGLQEQALVILEGAIARDDAEDSLHVWVADVVVFFHVLVHLDRALPEVHLAVEAQVKDDEGGTARHASCAMDEDLLIVQLLPHAIQYLDGLQKLLGQVIDLIEFWNGAIVQMVDVVLLIELSHALVILLLRLEAQNAFDPGGRQLDDVVFCDGAVANVETRVSYLAEFEIHSEKWSNYADNCNSSDNDTRSNIVNQTRV